jgi:hypothetical protein
MVMRGGHGENWTGTALRELFDTERVMDLLKDRIARWKGPERVRRAR